MSASVPISEYVNVSIALAPQPAGLAGFGRLLFVSKDASAGTVPVTKAERIRYYSSLIAVTADFPTGEINKAATVYYAQVPRPRDFYVGLIDGTDTAATATGNVTPNLATLQAIVAGGFTLTIDGSLVVISAVSLAATTSFAEVATALQTKLAVQKVGTTCTYVGGKFVITSPTTGALSTITVATSDISGLAAATGLLAAVLVQGRATETPVDALNACEQVDGSFYGVTLDTEFDDTEAAYDAAVWAQARTKTFFNTTNDPVALTSANTGTIAGRIDEAALGHTLTTYAPVAGSYAGVSVAGRAFTVNFEGTNTTITMMYKKLPTIPVARITPTQNKNLNAINVNVFLDVGGNSFFAESKMAGGGYFDTRHGIDWLQNRAETDVFNLMYQSETKVEYTDTGVSKIIQRLGQSLRQGVTNGLIAPGYTTDGTYLELGYRIDYVHVGDVSSADKGNRLYQGISFIATGAGAIHKVTITGSFSE
jgi:hypothetical protein